jgi:two-component system response regulator FixJ
MRSTHPVTATRTTHGAVGEATSGIFVVDDDEAVRDSLQLLLEAEGFEAFAFESGAAALAALDRSRPACLVLDLHMPGINGIELLEALAARDIQLPVVLITGHIDRKTRRRAAASGANVVLAKPLADAELVDAIRHAMALGSSAACAGV